MITLDALLPRLTDARVVGGGHQPIRRVHTDTRTLQAGDLFVALRGERFDAHAFLAQAGAAGAVAAVAESGLADAGLPGVEVPDTRHALGELAALWRGQMSLPLIAVTGSNGKTTVTQMLASILRAAAGDDTLATQGNFNNDIGVPLTLLRLRSNHRWAVVELGMNHPGEIAGLAVMARPTVVLVNNAQREHQEFMASVEAVARENASAFEAMGADGTAVFPAGDPYTGLWQSLARGRPVLTFGEPADGASVYGQSHWAGDAWLLQIHTPAGSIDVRLRLAGRHNVRNALAASACAVAAGVPLQAVARGLDAFEAVSGRSRALSVVWQDRSVTLIDDTYNANPDSVRAAIDVLAELPGPRLMVLGDMGEVGDRAAAFHQEVLGYALSRGVDRILVTGAHMLEAAMALRAIGQGRLCAHDSWSDLVADAMRTLEQANSVLVKGSRFMKMERLVQAIQQAAGHAATHTEGHHAA